MPTFHNFSDYVEPFWYMIEGETIVGEIYKHFVTEEDVKRYPILRAGQTVHMMMSVCSPGLYLVSEAVTDDFDDSELDAQVAKLASDGALYIKGIFIRLYKDYLSSYNIDSELKDDPEWDEFQRLGMFQSHKDILRIINQEFVENAMVFSEEELKIIETFIDAQSNYKRLLRRKRV